MARSSCDYGCPFKSIVTRQDIVIYAERSEIFFHFCNIHYSLFKCIESFPEGKSIVERKESQAMVHCALVRGVDLLYEVQLVHNIRVSIYVQNRCCLSPLL